MTLDDAMTALLIGYALGKLLRLPAFMAVVLTCATITTVNGVYAFVGTPWREIGLIALLQLAYVTSSLESAVVRPSST